MFCSMVINAQKWITPVDITGNVPESVKKASLVIDDITQKITSCLKNSNDRNQCICATKNDHMKLKQLYNEITSKHPKWKDTSVKYQEGDTQHMVSLIGIKLQLNQFEKMCK